MYVTYVRNLYHLQAKRKIFKTQKCYIKKFKLQKIPQEMEIDNRNMEIFGLLLTASNFQLT